MPKRKRFDDCPEWKAVGHHLGIRYRPRDVPVGETFKITLPVAVKAVEGELTEALGDAYACCAALVGLRLGPGPSIGQLDLMLLGRSGVVALGECKLSAATSHCASIHHALRQLEKYAKAIRGAPPTWLQKRIEDSYAKFGFPGCDELAEAIGIKTEDERNAWWSTVAATIRQGAFDLFIAVRTRGQSTIDVWRRSRV